MEEKGQQVVVTKPTIVWGKIHRTVAENCPLRRSIHRLPLLRSMIPVPGNDDGTVSPSHARGKTTSTTTTDSPSKTHFHIGKLIAPRKTHPAGEVNIPIEPGSSFIKNTGSRFRDKTGIPAQTQATTKPQIPVHGFQSKPAVKHKAAHKDEPGNIGGGHDHNHNYSSYIERVKNQLRSQSDIGEEITMEGPTATRIPAKRDSFNDRISNFITRAKKNIKTTHIGE